MKEIMGMERQSRLYQRLAKKYRGHNSNQAWLCYENALYHDSREPDGEGREEFCQECHREMELLQKEPDFAVAKTAIVLLSYNHGELTKACIESIRRNHAPGSYELIVVDNASTDGIQEWLRRQEDIRLIENAENQGFPAGCNQGIALAQEDADIFLLNNDTIVPENAIFWLRMGLYEEERIGAAGSVSNQVVNYQQVPQQFETTEEWMEFAAKNNVWMEHPYEKKSWLVGFAMLIKRRALEDVLKRERESGKGQVEALDTRFSPGNFEDNDLSIRLLLAGYRLILAKNSFIFHYGSKAFQKVPRRFVALLQDNRRKLAEKYGMDLVPASKIEMSLVDMVQPKDPSFSVLEIGCKLGATLARIESLYPGAEVVGIEENKFLSRLAGGVTSVICGKFPDTPVEGTFDYVIIDGILSAESDRILYQAGDCLKPGGKILAAVRNPQCVREREAGQEGAGATLDEITRLCNRCMLQIRSFHYRPAELTEAEKKKASELCGGWDSPQRPLYEAETFIFELGI